MESIDLDMIRPGKVIDRAECEKIVNVKKVENPYSYQFELLKLGKMLQRELWKVGKKYTVTTMDGEIQILGHADASDYNANRFDLALKAARAANRRMGAVDVSQLTPEQRKDHETGVVRQSRIISMLRTVPKSIALQPNADTRPKFVFKGGVK